MSKYRYGITGFVELLDYTAVKYSEIDALYWLREYITLLYIQPFNINNIIKCESADIVEAEHPETKITNLYHKTVFTRFPRTLMERGFYRMGQIIQVMLDLTSALAFLHNKKIIHRDIKPDNIVITHDDRAVILDFSHTYREIIPLRRLSTKITTYYYRAPEVFAYAEDKHNPLYSDAIDIWALGLVFLEMLTGCSFASWYCHHKKSKNVSSEETLARLLESKKNTYNQIEFYYKTFFRLYERNLYDTFHGWLRRMTAYDPADRITAAELYTMILATADHWNLRYAIPVNVPTDDLPEYISEIECDSELYQLSITTLETLCVGHELFLEPNRCTVVLKYLIREKIIVGENYNTVVSALSILIETIIYDRINTMKRFAALNTTEIKNQMYVLITRCGEQLFGYNRLFSYATI